MDDRLELVRTLLRAVVRRLLSAIAAGATTYVIWLGVEASPINHFNEGAYEFFWYWTHPAFLDGGDTARVLAIVAFIIGIAFGGGTGLKFTTMPIFALVMGALLILIIAMPAQFVVTTGLHMRPEKPLPAPKRIVLRRLCNAAQLARAIDTLYAFQMPAAYFRARLEFNHPPPEEEQIVFQHVVTTGEVLLLSGTSLRIGRTTSVASDAFIATGWDSAYAREVLTAFRPPLSWRDNPLLLAAGHSLGGMLAQRLPSHYIITFGSPQMVPHRADLPSYLTNESCIRTSFSNGCHRLLVQPHIELFAIKGDIVPSAPTMSMLQDVVVDADEIVSAPDWNSLYNVSHYTFQRSDITELNYGERTSIFSDRVALHNSYKANEELAEFDVIGFHHGGVCLVPLERGHPM